MSRESLRVGLAVSGGADSTALLVLMSQLREEHGFEAVVLHVDHGIRRESADDAAYVHELAERFGLPFHMHRTKVVRRKGESIEMAARRVRLAFFSDAMKRHRLDCIATGHHMDDVAETFIMRLKRSSGAEGLSGLKPVSFVDGIVFIRPLLNVRGRDLREFLQVRGVTWREDRTNSDTAIPRNKVRHVILPFLEREFDPKIVEHICRSAGYLREVCGTAHHANAKESLAVQGGGGNGSGTIPDDVPTKRYVLEVCESIGYERSATDVGHLPAIGFLDAAALRGRSVEIRTWRFGDWMRPCGFAHRRKLQDIFVTAKVCPAIRHSLPLVVDVRTGEVLWIPGYRVSESVKVQCMDAKSVRLTLSIDGKAKGASK